jgi:2-iminobutanoate/2-iminopropanoate deaminase
VFCSGQVGLDPATGELVDGGIEAQAERALTNLAAVLDAAGLTFADVVKTTCFLADMGDFAPFNAVYARFVTDPPPARSTFAVAALPKGAHVEIEAIAVRPRARQRVLTPLLAPENSRVTPSCRAIQSDGCGCLAAGLGTRMRSRLPR